MNSRILIFVAVTIAFACGVTAAPTDQILDAFETHRWEIWWGNATIVGMNGTHTTHGSTALQVQFQAAGTDLGGVHTFEQLLRENGSTASSGFSVDVYCEPVGGATGAPGIKIELEGDGNGNLSGTDTQLTTGAWTTVVLPASNMQGFYDRVGFVLVSKVGQNEGGNGTFNLWFDNVKRDSAIWEDFESPDNTLVSPSNIDVPFRGERVLEGATVGAPASAQGGHSYGMTWSSDADGTVEVSIKYPTGRDFTSWNVMATNVWVPSSQPLPTVSFYIVDNLGVGSFHTGYAPTANATWQEVRVRIDGLHTAVNSADIREVKIVAGGAGTAGTLFFDPAIVDVPVRMSGFSIE